MSNDKAIEEFKGHRDESIATVDSASNRALAEVQAAMVIAQRFPRDETQAFKSIMNACKRKSLAESAMYSYPRGGQKVTGPSIRLAEVLARCWKNIDFGTVELERRHGESSMMAYAWDLENNVRVTKVFQVAHSRAARGSIMKLTDPRDVYELTANQGARRVRACILGVIPGDVVEAAVEQCELTMREGHKEPLIDRVRKVVLAFDDYGVTKKQIELRLGHTLETITEVEFVQLRKIYVSIKDGMSEPRQWFEPETSEKMKSASEKPATLYDVFDSAPTPEEMAEDEKAHDASNEDGRDYQLEAEQKKGKRGKK